MSRLLLRNADSVIPLDEVCPACEGEGNFNKSAILKGTCAQCGGRGYLPSEAGKAILAFVERHKSQTPFPF